MPRSPTWRYVTNGTCHDFCWVADLNSLPTNLLCVCVCVVVVPTGQYVASIGEGTFAIQAVPALAIVRQEAAIQLEIPPKKEIWVRR